MGPGHQLRRYAWSAKLPVSILTDFEEFAIYDCRVAPKQMEKPSVARREYIVYTDYCDRWDFLEGTFSKRAILTGAFDRYCATKKGRGAQEFDEAFLVEIEDWRKRLASNLALRNELSEHDLNFATQRIIDRIIFLRICEDRGVEPVGHLQQLLNGENTYKRLVTLFREADARYNSGLFHFKREPGRDEAPDELTLDLEVDDATLKAILRRLYYPESPYEFTVVSADILGSVYERFLGKVIERRGEHGIKIVEKPEVRKAGGVYYTPTYIVDYIVKQTVGKLLEAKTPKDAAKLKILDPACGSGSFLLGAYQYLLDWHLKWYVSNDPQKWSKGKSAAIRPADRPSFTAENAGALTPFPGTPGEDRGEGLSPEQTRELGHWALTTTQRKQILLDNIHGVDIDYQAVEVTKLSLLLRCLEGETAESLRAFSTLFRERALPDLGHNIQCGNSLIGTDIMTTDAWRDMSEEERRRINPFDYERAFPGAFKPGGFDAVIGNPPYIRIQLMREDSPQTVELLSNQYVSASAGNYDIYVVFIEKGLQLLGPAGLLGFILPHKFFNASYGAPLREMLALGSHLKHIVHFGDQQVFAGATTYTCVFHLTRAPSTDFEFIQVNDLNRWRADGRAEHGRVPHEGLTRLPWTFDVGPATAITTKLAAIPTRIENIAARIAQGIRTSANEVFVVEAVAESRGICRVRSTQSDAEFELEAASLLEFLGGRDIKRYRDLRSSKRVIVPYEVVDGRAELISEREYERRFPRTMKYLRAHRRTLEGREHGRMRGERWYGYVYPKNLEVMLSPKILIPDIADSSQFAMDSRGAFAFTSGYGLTLRSDTLEAPEYCLGLLNSRLLTFFIRKVSTPLRGGFFRYFTQFIERLPCVRIDFDDKMASTRHNQLVAHVRSMLSLHASQASAKSPQEKEQLRRRIEATDRQIDALVYQLYGLSDEEIRIVESATTTQSTE